MHRSAAFEKIPDSATRPANAAGLPAPRPVSRAQLSDKIGRAEAVHGAARAIQIEERVTCKKKSEPRPSEVVTPPAKAKIEVFI